MRAMRLGRRRPPRPTPAHVVSASDEPAHPAPVERPERELASRQNDGLHVVLLWDPRDDSVAVLVADKRNGHAVRFAVEAARALDAFHHPFAYAR